MALSWCVLSVVCVGKVFLLSAHHAKEGSAAFCGWSSSGLNPSESPNLREPQRIPTTCGEHYKSYRALANFSDLQRLRTDPKAFILKAVPSRVVSPRHGTTSSRVGARHFLGCGRPPVLRLVARQSPLGLVFRCLGSRIVQPRQAL